ncbi:MAG: DUF4430 domain-containing protein [Solirubrobacteraceae bacterium]|nr:DUF4430 domain-containing protein [Solirubrobacteraceae bacterium]
MSRLRLLALLAALAVALSGCGLGGGQGDDDVSLLVTRDFGARTLGSFGPGPVEGSETIMRLLQRNFEVETRYGGGFVQAVDGIAGGREDGRPVDWFYYVNGVEADRGSASSPVHGGDRIWWDFRDWGTAPRVPAVVGAYPEPFVHGLNGKRWTTRVECVPGQEDLGPCGDVARRLGDAGVVAAKSLVATEGGDENLRVLVGPWQDLRFDRAGRLIDDGPQASGVFVRFSDDGTELQLLDARGEVARTLGPGSGLIAATRWEDQPPTWFVTGTDQEGVKAAVRALEEGALGGRYALAVADDVGIPLPVVEDRGGR